jgi:predicted transglutaminase-like cysteine proteinase
LCTFGHAVRIIWSLLYHDGEWFILDNLTNVLVRDWEKTEYEPLAILDYKGARRYLSAFCTQ